MKKIFKHTLMIFLIIGLNPAQSAMITLDAIDNGWYAQNGAHPNNSASTWTGTDGNGLFRNSFYSFDVSSLANASITSAEIVFVASGVYRSQDDSETLQVWDVSTMPGNGFSSTVYDDLMSGVLYGQVDVNGKFKQAMPEITVELSSLSFSDIVDGDIFNLGAAISTLSTDKQQVLWWGSEILPAAQLLVNFDEQVNQANTVSAPSNLAILGLMVMGICGSRRRKNK